MVGKLAQPPRSNKKRHDWQLVAGPKITCEKQVELRLLELTSLAENIRTGRDRLGKDD